MVHDCDFYHYFLDHGTYPDEGMKGSAYSNSGVFLIKPGKLNRMKILNLNIYSNLDREEFLYLINLKNSSLVEPHPWSSGGEQGFINEVYLWERLDLGLHNNLFMHYILVTGNLIIKQSLFNDLLCNYFKDAKYQDFIANLTPSIYHFAGWKPEKVCTDDPPKWEPCNLYKFYARKICSD